MSEETNHKALRQEPVADIQRNQHKTGKRKVWRFKSEWLPEKTFTTRSRVDGEWVDTVHTLKQIMALEGIGFYYARMGPIHPYCKFKTLEDAMRSWEAMIQKKEIHDLSKYWLENTETGEMIILSHIT